MMTQDRINEMKLCYHHWNGSAVMEGAFAALLDEVEGLREELFDLRTDHSAQAVRIQAGDRARDDVIEECALVCDARQNFTVGSILRRLKTKPLS